MATEDEVEDQIATGKLLIKYKDTPGLILEMANIVLLAEKLDTINSRYVLI